MPGPGRPRFDRDRAIDPTILTTLLDRAARAPSGFDLQPWRFLLVRSRRARDRLRPACLGHPDLGEATAVVVVLGYLRGLETDLNPLLDRRIAAGMPPEAAAEARRRATDGLARLDRAAWAVRWAMLAAGTLVAAAEAAGLVATVIDRFDRDGIDQALGIPTDHAVACLVALGHSSEDESSPTPPRFGLDHLGYEEHFGGPWTLGEPGGDPGPFKPPR